MFTDGLETLFFFKIAFERLTFKIENALRTAADSNNRFDPRDFSLAQMQSFVFITLIYSKNTMKYKTESYEISRVRSTCSAAVKRVSSCTTISFEIILKNRFLIISISFLSPHSQQQHPSSHTSSVAVIEKINK